MTYHLNVYVAQGHQALIAEQPRLYERLGLRQVLDQADGGGKIVEKPAGTAIVEIYDVDVRPIGQQICESQIAVYEPEPVGRLAVSASLFAISTEALRSTATAWASNPGARSQEPHTARAPINVT